MSDLFPEPAEVTAEELRANPILQFFHYEHLPERLQKRSKHFAILALDMVRTLEPSAERTAGLRKLLEAKDCFVRCQVMEKENVRR